jgi:hypothetical protein
MSPILPSGKVQVNSSGLYEVVRREINHKERFTTKTQTLGKNTLGRWNTKDSKKEILAAEVTERIEAGMGPGKNTIWREQSLRLTPVFPAGDAR